MAYIGNDPSNIQRGRRAQYHFTATASQTSFSGTDDDGLQLDLLESVENDVYLNGARLVLDDDYTISGNTLTLTAAAAAGDILVVVTQDDIINLNSYTKGEADSRYINYDGDIVNGDLQVVGNISLTDLTTRHIYLTGGVRNIGGNDLFTYMTGTDSGGNERGIIVGQGTVRPNADAAISLGQSAVRFTDLHLSGRANTVGITSNDNSHIFTSPSYNIIDFISDNNDDGSNDDIIVNFRNGSAGTIKAELRWDESSDTFEISRADNRGDLVLSAQGNVGIGTDSPTEKLVIKGDGARLTVESADMEVAMLGRRGSSGSALDSGYLRLRRQGVTADGVVIDTDGSSWLNGGNVGIGTSSPTALLNLQKTRSGLISNGSNDTGAVIKLHTEAQWESGYGNNPAASTNDYLGSIEFSTGDSSTGEGVRAAIRGTVDSYYNSNSIVFETAGSATAEAPQERMRVLYNGNVGIGTAIPQTKLQVDGTVYATAVDHGDGSSADRAATSALEILRYYGNKPSGNYWIKEPVTGTPRQIYCDMQTDGGGWMLWLEYNTSQNSMHNQIGTRSNMNRQYNNNYASYEVMLDGSDVNNINKRSIRGVYELDTNGEIRANGVRQWGERILPENVGNPFEPGSDTFFNDGADGEYIQRTQYYTPTGGASGGWQSIGTGSLYVYIREPNPLVRNGDIKTYYGMPLVYDYYDSTKYGWHVPDYAYATGEIGMTPGFSGIAIDGSDFPIASGYANRRIDVNNGNNGPSAQGMLRGYLIGEFQIRFYLGYRWGWSELALVDVKSAYESKYLGGGGYSVYKNVYRVMNNSSNNVAEYISFDSAGTQSTLSGSSYSEGNTWTMWRTASGIIRVKDPGGTTRDLGQFVGPMVAMSGSQSPHVLEIRDVWSRGRNSVTSNNNGTDMQFRH